MFHSDQDPYKTTLLPPSVLLLDSSWIQHRGRPYGSKRLLMRSWQVRPWRQRAEWRKMVEVDLQKKTRNPPCLRTQNQAAFAGKNTTCAQGNYRETKFLLPQETSPTFPAGKENGMGAIWYSQPHTTEEKGGYIRLQSKSFLLPYFLKTRIPSLAKRAVSLTSVSQVQEGRRKEGWERKGRQKEGWKKIAYCIHYSYQWYLDIPISETLKWKREHGFPEQ